MSNYIPVEGNADLVRDPNTDQIVNTNTSAYQQYIAQRQRRKLQKEKSSQSYLQQFGELSSKIHPRTSWQEWINIYKELTKWQMELAEGDQALVQVLENQFRDANREFGKFIQNNYETWLNEDREEAPLLSPEVIKKYVLPAIKDGKKTMFF